MYGDSKAITSDKECKKFECHETTVSRSRQATRANTFITIVIVDITAAPAQYIVGQ